VFKDSFLYISLAFEDPYEFLLVEDSFVVSSLSGIPLSRPFKPLPGQYIGSKEISSYSIGHSLGINTSFSQ
jgi:hypothetical protein